MNPVEESMADYTDKEPSLRQQNLKAYRAWVRMLHRCHNERSGDFRLYGARGISVCERWRDEGVGFANFIADIGPPPSDDSTIDRIDNDGNYEPSNVRWASRTEQGRNRRTNKFIEHAGFRLTMSEWAERMGVDRRVLHKRLKLGWPLDRALSEAFPDGNKIAA